MNAARTGRPSAPGTSAGYELCATIPVDPSGARICVEGWQSWSPSGTYRLADEPPAPHSSTVLSLGYRADLPPRQGVFQGEGLLAVLPGPGAPVTVFADTLDVASIRAVATGSGLEVRATGPVQVSIWETGGDLNLALGLWAAATVAELEGHRVRPAPTAWCSWYHYFTSVTQADMDENLSAMADLELPVDVVQVDDGYQAQIGDWLDLSDRFGSRAGLARRIAAHGRRAGIWVAPFLVGSRSRLAREHPDWLVAGAHAGHNWGQDLLVLDVTHPGAAAHLAEVFAALRGDGFDYFKIDFCYAGALRGRRHEPAAGGAGGQSTGSGRDRAPEIAAYRAGLRLIRAAIGAESYLLGCGAPTLASIGLVDAMRISPDTATHYEPSDGDPSQPGQRSAISNGRARAWQQGRLWVNDPDCILARPGVERRQEWAAHISEVGGLRASSDRLADLDPWGLDTTRCLLANVPPPLPFNGQPATTSGGQ